MVSPPPYLRGRARMLGLWLLCIPFLLRCRIAVNFDISNLLPVAARVPIAEVRAGSVLVGAVVEGSPWTSAFNGRLFGKLGLARLVAARSAC